MNPLKEFFADEMVLSAMSKGNHFTKQEVLKWLSVHLPEARSVPREDMMAMVPTLYAAVEDRNADVRKAAQDAVPAFMRHLGFQKMQVSKFNTLSFAFVTFFKFSSFSSMNCKLYRVVHLLG